MNKVSGQYARHSSAFAGNMYLFGVTANENFQRLSYGIQDYTVA